MGPPPPSEAVLEVTYIEVVHAWDCVLHVAGLPERVAAVMAVLPYCHSVAKHWQAVAGQPRDFTSRLR